MTGFVPQSSLRPHEVFTSLRLGCREPGYEILSTAYRSNLIQRHTRHFNHVRPLTVLHTARLRLEPITDQHLDGVYEMDREAEVMRYISGEPATREQTAAWIAR
jgi:hypothetical protein